MTQVNLDGAAVYAKLQKIYDTWEKIDNKPEALLVVLGKTPEDESLIRNNSEDFILWLVQYQFNDSILLMTREKVVFAVSPKKKTMLEGMSKPVDYSGPKLVLVEKALKMDAEQNRQFATSFLKNHLEGISASAVSIFQKNEKIDGALSQAVMDHLASGPPMEMRDFMLACNTTKISPEQANLKLAAGFVEWSSQRMISEIETCIEGELAIKNSQIASKIERSLDDDEKIGKFCSKFGVSSADALDYPLPVLVQSAQQKGTEGNFTLNKFTGGSDKNELAASLIFMNICGKYVDMHSMACRTILINPTASQKKTYTLAYEAHQHLLTLLTEGNTLDSVYKSTKAFIIKQDPSLKDRLHSNFGFGVGLAYKEDGLLIAEGNETKVGPNMAFHVRITIKDAVVKGEKGKELTLAAIGDTVLVEEDAGELKVTNLTGKVPAKFGGITYTLDDEDDKDKENVSQNGARDTAAGSGLEPQILDGRTRGERKQTENQSKKDFEKELKENQARLQQEKAAELKKRFEKGEISQSAKKQRVKNLGLIQSYSSMKKVPSNLVKGQLYVDNENDTILVPIDACMFVPFHVSTINNLSKQSEGAWTYLRINFHTPSPGKSATLQFPDLKENPNAVFLKELTLKNKDHKGDANHLHIVDKKIKDLIKKVKTKDQEEDDRLEDQANMKSIQPLKPIPGRRDALENVIIKPNLEGKKSIGNLELHSNGLRYVSTKGLKLDIPFSQVKHAFFQPCASDELVAIIHFTLKYPMTFSNKKIYDIQFFKESGITADDIDMRGARRRLNDLDELELEQRERQAKQKLSDRFYKFARLIDNQANAANIPVNVDMPLEDVYFMGCPAKSSVKIRPTNRNCLIAISEFPSFVLDINDIEVVHFERVQFGIRNIDMAIILKDFTTFKRINSIPREQIEELKEYLDSVGLIYSESVTAFNWQAILTKIRGDFQEFLDDGAWKFLQDDDDAEADGDDEDEDDPVFDEEVDSESDDDESDFSDEDEDDDDSDEPSSGSEEGLSWDEMEKRALDEDKKQAARRQENNQNKGRSKAPARRR